MSKPAVKIFQNKKAFIAFANIVGIILVSTSITFSLLLAKQQAIKKETARLKTTTNDVLERMLKMRTQFSEIAATFSSIPSEDACSASNVKEMQKVDVSAFFLQAIGHLNDTTIDCSSLPGLFDGIRLGEPYAIEPDGTRVWAHVNVPGWDNESYVVIGQHDYVAVIVPRHSIEALGNPEISVGIFNIKSHVLYTSKGQIKPEWIDSYRGNGPQTFIDKDGKYIVYIAPNKSNRSAVISAIPMSETSDDIRNSAKILIPMGILLGLGLAGGFLYLAKRTYSPKSELLKGLARNEFYLEYQPIIDLRDRTCVGAEALIRWRTPAGVFVRPDLFIPIAEETGVICQLTQRVFELIATDLGETLKTNPNFHIGINVSSSDLQSGDLIKLVENLMKTTGSAHSQIIIEATERGFLNDGVSLGVMKGMRASGIQVAIDDFGTGYSSLSYLTKFDLDFLKIDKTFVDSIGTDAVTGHVAFHIIEMAKSLNLAMIAEGVETEKQAEILLERGVTYVQGWLFSKSLRPEEFIAYLEQHSLQ